MTTTLIPPLAVPLLGRQPTLTRYVALALAGSMALWAAAKIQIPFYPVPQTLQTLAVVFVGSVLGWRAGALAVATYLLEGMVGLPVFAGAPARGVGLAYMMGPTGGYLLGYLGAATLCGWLAERGWNKTVPATLASASLGIALIYGAGLAWLGTVVGWDKPLLAWGATPFLLGDAVKVALSAAILPILPRIVGRGRADLD